MWEEVRNPQLGLYVDRPGGTYNHRKLQVCSANLKYHGSIFWWICKHNPCTAIKAARIGYLNDYNPAFELEVLTLTIISFSQNVLRFFKRKILHIGRARPEKGGAAQKKIRGNLCCDFFTTGFFPRPGNRTGDQTTRIFLSLSEQENHFKSSPFNLPKSIMPDVYLNRNPLTNSTHIQTQSYLL